jgi:hypothetical protein
MMAVVSSRSFAVAGRTVKSATFDLAKEPYRALLNKAALTTVRNAPVKHLLTAGIHRSNASAASPRRHLRTP